MTSHLMPLVLLVLLGLMACGPRSTQAAQPMAGAEARALVELELETAPPCLCPDPVRDAAEPCVATGQAPWDPAGVAALERALVGQAPERLRLAREALRRGDYPGAVAQLDPLRQTSAWPQAAPFWAEAVDGLVGAERERAGELYLEASRAPRSTRRELLLEVRQLLADLIDTYPESAYALPLQGNLERVERELEMLP